MDAFEPEPIQGLFPIDRSTDDRLGFNNATFSWSNESDRSPSSRQRQFVLKIEGELLFERGRVNLVVGPTGSGDILPVWQGIMCSSSAGKTSLLMALLGMCNVSVFKTFLISF